MNKIKSKTENFNFVINWFYVFYLISKNILHKFMHKIYIWMYIKMQNFIKIFEKFESINFKS